MIAKMRTKRGLSPVIATVILVAVAITVAVGVAYWMSGIASQYTAFEKIEITSCVVTMDGFDNWIVTVDLKNTGTATATITMVFVNENQATPDSVAPSVADVNITTSLTTVTTWKLKSGEENTVLVWIGVDFGFLSSGTTVNIKLHSAAGMDYIKLVKLT